MERQVKISVVIPAYNEEEGIKVCYEQVNEECLKLNKDYEIIFVNDGSKDKTLEVLEEIANQNKRVKVVNFSRNFGQLPALFSGFKYASGDAIINIDADLQDPVSLIGEFVEKWEEGFDVVLAKRKSRKGESWFKKFTSKVYYKLYKWLSKSKSPEGCGISRLLSKRVVEQILSMPEHNMYLAGMTDYVGYKQTVIEFDREERKLGETKYTLKKMVKLALDGILPYSVAPIGFVMGLGLFLGFGGVAMLIVLGVLALCSVAFANTLWVIATIITLGGVVTSSIGLVGLYISRVYAEVLNRPKYIVAKTYNLGEDNE